MAHTCGFLGVPAQAFDIADVAGDGTDLLVRNAGLGRALAEHLDKAAVVLMRGHGFTTVGTSVSEAVFRAVYTSLNCHLLTVALQLGEPKALTPGEAEACDRATSSQTSRAWDLWVAELGEIPSILA